MTGDSNSGRDTETRARRRGRKTLTSQRGLTLVEVTVMLTATLAILAVLAPTLAATLADVKTTRATTDMQTIRDAITNFLADGFTQFTGEPGEKMEFLFSDGDIPDIGQSSNWRTTTATSDKGFLEEHLVINSFEGGNAYGAAWRGAYINAPVNPDPWGNRYAVNTFAFPAGGDDVVVFSAGPDEDVDSGDTPVGATPTGDDLMILVQG